MVEKNGLKIISLGGFGRVTNNMFVYETERDILIVDCGVGFPTQEMFGVDLTIPDISYLETKKGKIRGIVLTHGHDDHIGALPYILPKLPAVPIFGSRWSLALARDRLKEIGLGAQLEEVGSGDKISLGGFNIDFIEVTHSIPETFHLVINTPVGRIYHAADFKLDLTPVMGKPTDQNLIKAVGGKGIFCLLSDCLRAEKPGFTPSESKIEEIFEQELVNCQGKFLMTTMSSNLSRLKQAIDVSLRHHRQIVLVGRSIEKNIKLALKMGYLKYPQNVFVSVRNAKKLPPNTLTLLVAGSQAQEGSALERIVSGEHEIKIKMGDKIVFSSDYIPGNEIQIYNLIDELLHLKADVLYTDILSEVHVSGHGQAQDLRKLMELVSPKYLLPIGGSLHHMVAYQKLALKSGYKEKDVLLPENGQIVRFTSDGQVNFDQRIQTKIVMVDALGVGDVGHVVLRDRQVLASEGIVVAIIQVEQGNLNLIEEPDIITRGFVYAKESEELLGLAKKEIKRVILRQKRKEVRSLRRDLQETLEELFFRQIGRQPMILPVIVEV